MVFVFGIKTNKNETGTEVKETFFCNLEGSCAWHQRGTLMTLSIVDDF